MTGADVRPFVGRATCPTCGPLRDISAASERDLSYWIARAHDRHRRECRRIPKRKGTA